MTPEKIDEALAAGADVVNDAWGGVDPELAEVAAAVAQSNAAPGPDLGGTFDERRKLDASLRVHLVNGAAGHVVVELGKDRPLPVLPGNSPPGRGTGGRPAPVSRTGPGTDQARRSLPAAVRACAPPGPAPS